MPPAARHVDEAHVDDAHVAVARALIDAIPSRNRAFDAYEDQTFSKGAQLARLLVDLARTIRAMRARGQRHAIEQTDPHVAIVHTVDETRALPVRRASTVPVAALALLAELVERGPPSEVAQAPRSRAS